MVNKALITDAPTTVPGHAQADVLAAVATVVPAHALRHAQAAARAAPIHAKVHVQAVLGPASAIAQTHAQAAAQAVPAVPAAVSMGVQVVPKHAAAVAAATADMGTIMRAIITEVQHEDI